MKALLQYFGYTLVKTKDYEKLVRKVQDTLDRNYRYRQRNRELRRVLGMEE
jgi:hypothetical protein